jgi:hypothetical protein
MSALFKIDELLLKLAWEEPEVLSKMREHAFHPHNNDLTLKTQLVIESYRRIKDDIGSLAGGCLFDYAVQDIPGKGRGIVCNQEIKKGDIVYIFRDMFTFDEDELIFCLEQMESDVERSDFLTFLYTIGDADGFWPKSNIAVFDPSDLMYCNHGTDDSLIEDYTHLCSIANKDFHIGEEYVDDYSKYSALEWFERLCQKYQSLSVSQCCMMLNQGVFKRGPSNSQYMVVEKGLVL